MREFLYLAFIAILLSLPLFTDAENIKRQNMCPVMGREIDKSLYVDKGNKRIYVCCAGCKEEVKNNFDKYAAQLENEGYNLNPDKNKK